MGKLVLGITVIVLVAVVMVACTDVGYYLHCARGHLTLMSLYRPIDDVISDPRTTAERRAQLEEVRTVRDFASRTLALPDNGSYRTFADVGRPYVVWNVVAAPELSLTPRQWCFPVAGCVAYRGYFNEEAAQREADRLAADGYDVDVYGVQAYSTLNWFNDPVLNTFLDQSGVAAASLIFHELAHQVVYVADDSRFNEAFARTVELEGVRRWLMDNADNETWERYRRQEERIESFSELLGTVRSELETLYESSLSDDAKRTERRRIVMTTANRYQQLKASWGGYAGFDPWMEKGLNNARLASLATYRDLVPAFQGLLAASAGDLPAFYRRVEELAALAASERIARLKIYAPPTDVRAGGRPTAGAPGLANANFR